MQIMNPSKTIVFTMYFALIRVCTHVLKCTRVSLGFLEALEVIFDPRRRFWTQKPPKMRSKIIPEDTQFANKPNRWNLMKTLIFTMVYAHPGIGFWCDFHSQNTKKPTLEPILSLWCPKSRKCHQNDPKVGAKRVPKSTQNR